MLQTDQSVVVKTLIFGFVEFRSCLLVLECLGFILEIQQVVFRTVEIEMDTTDSSLKLFDRIIFDNSA